MKKVVIAIQPTIRINTFNGDGKMWTETRRQYFGTVWGAYLEVYTYSFNLFDENGYIVYTGAVKDLHALAPNERTFDDGKYSEFRFEPIETYHI